ncbi:TRAP transporter small permease [Plastorhodobacter daqingensis]|uniref:TRAP transporter small permease protein n=1 Tax=Plastorhodobacter daqingensis TaxID=1387281 RepID=A0ABW2UGM5_9RHOB
MHRIDRLLQSICSLAALAGILAILALMLLTVVTVVFRAVGIAFPGTYSLSELLLIPAVSLSLAYAAVRNEHTRVSLFVDLIRNGRLRRAVQGTMLALGSLFWVAVAWATAREAIRRGAQGELSPIINVPVAPFRWVMAGAIVLFVVVLLWQAVSLWLGRGIGDEDQKLENKL